MPCDWLKYFQNDYDIGHQVVLMSMDEYDTTNIAQLEDLFIITSTHGEGEPPDNAWDFF